MLSIVATPWSGVCGDVLVIFKIDLTFLFEILSHPQSAGITISQINSTTLHQPRHRSTIPSLTRPRQLPFTSSRPILVTLTIQQTLQITSRPRQISSSYRFKRQTQVYKAIIIWVMAIRVFSSGEDLSSSGSFLLLCLTSQAQGEEETSFSVESIS